MAPKKYFCGGCKLEVEDNSIRCIGCKKWYHQACTEFDELPEQDPKWTCSSCVKKAEKESSELCFKCKTNFKIEDTRRSCKTCANVVHGSCGDKDWVCEECSPPLDNYASEFEIQSCGECNANVDCDDDGHQCESCEIWFHNNCMQSSLHCNKCVIKMAIEGAEHTKILNEELIEKNQQLNYENNELKTQIASIEDLLQKLVAKGEEQDKRIEELLKLSNSPRVQPKPSSVIDPSILQRAMKLVEFSKKESKAKPSLFSSIQNEISTNQIQIVSPPILSTQINQHESLSFNKDEQEARKQRKTLMELPSFSGVVLEWPAFIRIYNQTTRMGMYRDYENISRLQKALTGKAAQRVKPLLDFGNSAEMIIKTLEENFGRPGDIIKAASDDIKSIPKLTDVLDSQTIKFSVNVLSYVEIVRSLNRPEDMHNTDLLTAAVNILCAEHKREWNRLAKCIKDGGLKKQADMEDFSNFVISLAAEIPTEDLKRKGDRNPKRVNVVHQQKSENSSSNYSSCFKCNQSHILRTCKEFRALDVKQRIKFVFDNKICSRCLTKKNHEFKNCPIRCDTPNCNGTHNTLLHDESKRKVNQQNQENVEIIPRNLNTHRIAESALSEATSDRLNLIVPIRVYCGTGNEFVDTHAMFDNGADVTLIDEDFWKALKIKFKPTTLKTMWTKDFIRSEKSNVGNLNISTIHGGVKYLLRNVSTVKNINLKKISFNPRKMQEKYDHLKGLKLNNYNEVQPKILLGIDNAKLMTLSDSRCGTTHDEPVASKTIFGWSVWGPTDGEKNSNNFNSSYIVRRILSHTRSTFENDVDEFDDIHRIVKEGFSIDNLGVFSNKPLVGHDEKRSNKIMNDSIKIENGRVSMKLLWKEDNMILPDNFKNAVRRMELDEKRTEKLGLVEWKSNLIKDQLAKGYIRKATDHDLNSVWDRVWYCPQFVTFNENKIPPKPRNVCDVAAKTHGISLNTCLLKGPDNLIPLPRSLMRLRENAIAFTADVREMFHQIRIQSPDDQCQRFLFRDGDKNMDPKDAIYIMSAMMFGPTCSPSMSQFAKNYLAEKFKETHQKSYDVLTKFTYVDDSSDSQPNVDDALESAMGCIDIYKSGGFDLVSFQSNSTELLKRLPSSHIKGDLVSLVDKSDSENIVKILGLNWSTSTDEFLFVFKKDTNFTELQKGDITKRRCVRMLMQIYDPLGFIAIVVIRGKFVIQRMWQNGSDWDEVVNENIQVAWREFEEELKSVTNVRIPRRFSSSIPSESKVQLLIFVDSSDVAYAAVAYLRFQDESGDNYQVSLTMAKSRVAPVKYVSIPRLELNAAVLGNRVALSVQEWINFPIHEVKYFSDSKTVLSWIKSTEYKFKPFVAARVGEILDTTTVNQWNYIPSKENVADDGTKWKGTRQFHSNSRWFQGPSFLKTDEVNWPTSPAECVENSGLDEVTSFTYIHHYKPTETLEFLDRFKMWNLNSWHSFIRSVAYVRRFALLRFNKEKRITIPELRDAEKTVFKKIQLDCYGVIISDLEYINELRKAGKSDEELNQLYAESLGELQPLLPYIDEKDGLLRVSSRIQSSKFSYAFRNPIILPNKHPWMELLVKHYHKINCHILDNTTLGDLRKFCWIMQPQKLLRRVKRSCKECREDRLKPRAPQMGNLHESRYDFGCKPWTHVGIDAFGPLEVIVGRSRPKRYGMIFTCLTYRAVHLELVEDMSANHCMLAIRNFLALRSVSKHFYSDNGTNFRASQRWMHEDFVKMQQELSENVAKSKQVEWHFISPFSPWKGGAWEILIKYVKRCLKFTFDNSLVHNERVLVTAFNEISCLMNRRPLTNAPSDPNNDQPLTPNTVLIGDDEHDLQLTTGVFDEGDECSSRFYRRAECLVRKYMSKFIRDYLPDLAIREKWFTPIEVKLGDIVLWFEKSKDNAFTKPSIKMWKRAKVIKLHRSKNGNVSVVDILVGGDRPKVMRYRAVANLIFLNVNANENGIQPSLPEYEGECYENEEFDEGI